MKKKILIDGREFVSGRKTGIARFLGGLIGAITTLRPQIETIIVVSGKDSVPPHVEAKENLLIHENPAGFIRSEKYISKLTKEDISLFLSPYPKLPLFGCYCPAINTIHDVLDLTHPAYKKRVKASLDKYRLRSALKNADLTWYVSECSKKETKRFIGSVGRNPKVRYNAIDKRFSPKIQIEDNKIIGRYGLEQGYILVLGNGLPHKNLGVLLEISQELKRTLIFAGVPKAKQDCWISLYPKSKVLWIEHIPDHDLPAIIRGGFCLAQPSTAEGYGYPPLEAMACGVPAVVNDIPVLRETTSGFAFFAEASDSKSWIDAFHRLENGNVYQDQVNKGLKWIAPLLGQKGWEKHVSDIQEVINSKR